MPRLRPPLPLPDLTCAQSKPERNGRENTVHKIHIRGTGLHPGLDRWRTAEMRLSAAQRIGASADYANGVVLIRCRRVRTAAMLDAPVAARDDRA